MTLPTALCETEAFTQAYYNCMAYHCTDEEYQQGVVLGQAVCASVGGTLRESPCSAAYSLFMPCSAAALAI